MAHEQHRRFCSVVSALFPSHFLGSRVLDIGSMDVNGTNRPLFRKCHYIGVDLGPGKNVDVVCPGHRHDGPDNWFDVVISTECGEHDRYWVATIANAIRMLKPGGLLLYTCATTGRAEHGTTRTSLWESPYTNDYYRNLTQADLESVPGFKSAWRYNRFMINEENHDLQFWGIKRGYTRDFKPRLMLFILRYSLFFIHNRIHDLKNAARKWRILLRRSGSK